MFYTHLLLAIITPFTVITFVLVLINQVRQEKLMTKLSDDVAALKTAVDANTVAVGSAAANVADVAAAEAVIEAETAQVEANTAALSPAPPVTP